MNFNDYEYWLTHKFGGEPAEDDEDDYEDEKPARKKSDLKFKDLKVGMKFRCHSEDNDYEYWDGEIESITVITGYKNIEGHLAIQFNDEVGSWCAAAPDANLYDFMEPLE